MKGNYWGGRNRGEDLRKRLTLVEENSDAIGLYRIGRGLTTLRCNLFCRY